MKDWYSSKYVQSTFELRNSTKIKKAWKKTRHTMPSTQDKKILKNSGRRTLRFIKFYSWQSGLQI